MEDDEENQSQASEESGSPAASHGSNGRISVTVAAHAPSHKNLTLALPIQQQQSRPPPPTGNSGGGGGGGGGGREDCWSEGATGILIDAWGERYLELSRGNLKQKHWKDVSDIVSNRDDYNKPPKTDIQCKNRIDTVKKKYKMEKAKMAAGSGPSKWPFFHKLDQLIGSRAKTGPATAGSGGAGPSIPFSGNQRVPVGILIGSRSAPQPMRSQQQHKPPVRKRFRADQWDQVSEPEASPDADSADEFQPETYERKRPRIHGERNRVRDEGEKGNGTEKNWGNSLRELTRAILKFGEVYEQAENSKLQQVVDMEKQRMKFAKELEMQRMKSFMETQMELSQLNHRRLGTGHNHHCSNNRATNNDDLSESSD